MQIKRYYIADFTFTTTKCDICVCRPFEKNNKLLVDTWHPVTQRYLGRRNVSRWRKDFFSNICADFYSLKEAFDAVANYKNPLPEEALIGYKLLRHKERTYLLGILEIPARAKKVAPYFSRKMRADYVFVKDILRLVPYRRTYKTTISNEDFGFSSISHGQVLRYIRGGLVCADSLDEDRTMVATHGIHFYLTKEEAINSLKRMRYV